MLMLPIGCSVGQLANRIDASYVIQAHAVELGPDLFARELLDLLGAKLIDVIVQCVKQLLCG
jgi:hypothetical protein